MGTNGIESADLPFGMRFGACCRVKASIWSAAFVKRLEDAGDSGMSSGIGLALEG